MFHRMFSSGACWTLLCALASAQGPAFQTPGMPTGGRLGQTDRFSNDFNPAIGFVFDFLGSYTTEDGDGEDGFDLELRTLELNGAAYVDPDAWAYAVIVAGEEEIGVEEAAVIYSGLGGHHDLRAGRFFVDFGKQMQAHVHDLRTIDRPLVLREYLGDELGGDGIQWDNWFAPSDTIAVRYSLGVFQSLAGEAEEDAEVAISEPSRKHASELGYTARVTGFSDIGNRSILQLGGSGRFLPSFTLEAADESVAPLDDNSNTVFGADLTYGWTSETGNQKLTAGGEWLIDTGDIGATVADTADGPALAVLDDDAAGWYLFADYGWNPNHGAGLQWSLAELPEAGLPEVNEYDAYFTWHMTELRRLRFGVTLQDVENGNDSVRFAIQFTNFIGVHSHGVNW